MINSCICSYCNKWHSHITYDKYGKSICIECKNKDKIKIEVKNVFCNK